MSYAMTVLRVDRNQKLRDTDHYMIADWPITEEKREEWKAYRQALRDITTTADPQVDDNGHLINVVWPEMPKG
jgi:hypothetical protein